jgi:hypothetical protein
VFKFSIFPQKTENFLVLQTAKKLLSDFVNYTVTQMTHGALMVKREVCQTLLPTA